MTEKQNIVYFLGAGSSFCFGYPLTWEMMPEILERLKTGTLFNMVKEQERTSNDPLVEKELLGYIENVYPGLVDIDLPREASHVPNIIEIFSFVDHLRFYNTTHRSKIKETDLSRFRMLLNRALAELMRIRQYSIQHDIRKYEKEITLKEKFVTSIKQECDDSDNNVSIITTNYDMIIDRAFVDIASQGLINYGFSYRSVATNEVIYQPAKPKLNYYKLHGSLNWLMCNFCGWYYINPSYSIVHQEFREKADANNLCTCNDDIQLKSVLVAPSSVRDIRDSNLLQIWREAQESIRKATKLVMVGYSLPAEDLAIKSILMRGINDRCDNTQLELEVIQDGFKAQPNYQNIFGKIFQKEKYYDGGLMKYLDSKTATSG